MLHILIFNCWKSVTWTNIYYQTPTLFMTSLKIYNSQLMIGVCSFNWSPRRRIINSCKVNKKLGLFAPSLKQGQRHVQMRCLRCGFSLLWAAFSQSQLAFSKAGSVCDLFLLLLSSLWNIKKWSRSVALWITGIFLISKQKIGWDLGAGSVTFQVYKRFCFFFFLNCSTKVIDFWKWFWSQHLWHLKSI